MLMTTNVSMSTPASRHRCAAGRRHHVLHASETSPHAHLIAHDFGCVREFRGCDGGDLGASAVRAELVELLELLRERVSYLDHPLGLPEIPLAVHSRYTRTEILAAFGVGEGARPRTWQSGVWWEPEVQTDLFAFTLDKSVGGFSPTTRYRDYAVSSDLIHWESQSATAADSPTGQRYIHQRDAGTNVVLFARLRTSDRAFWCLGRASYVSHEGDRPINSCSSSTGACPLSSMRHSPTVAVGQSRVGSLASRLPLFVAKLAAIFALVPARGVFDSGSGVRVVLVEGLVLEQRLRQRVEPRAVLAQ